MKTTPPDKPHKRSWTAGPGLLGEAEHDLVSMARIKQNGILGQLLRDSWLALTEGLL